MKVVKVLTNSSTEIGLGHLYRMCFLKEHLLKVNIFLEINVICNNPDEILEFSFCNQFYSHEEAIRYLRLYPKVLIIFDLYDYSSEVLTFIHFRIGNNICFGMNVKAHPNINIVINVAHGNTYFSEEFKKGSTLFLSGAQFAIQPPNNLIYKSNYIPTGCINKICVVFGGSDPSNLTLKTVNYLVSCGTKVRFTVRISEHHKDCGYVKKLTRCSKNIELIDKFENVFDFFKSHDFAIISPGNLLFEAAHYGIPCYAFTHSKIQQSDFNKYPNVKPSEKLVEVISKLLESNKINHLYWQEYYSDLNVGSGLKLIKEYIGVLSNE